MPKFTAKFKKHKRSQSAKQTVAAATIKKQVQSFFRQLCGCFFILCIVDIAACAECPCSFCGEATYCHQMELTTIPSKSLAGFTNVKRLLLHSNNIVTIKNNSFEEMGNLLEIDLHGNKIQVLEKNAFYGLDMLENLHLSDNAISVVPDGVFRTMVNLKGLFLDGNKLSILPGDIPFMKSLVKLNIAGNQITQITWYSWLSLPKAESILMTRNPFKCNCNLQEMIKWFKTSVDGLSISTDITSTECTVENKTDCGNIEINKISKLNSVEGKPFVEMATEMLQCTAEGNPSPLIVWKTPTGKLIYPLDHKEDKYSFYNGTLVLPVISMADAGLYTCYAQHASKKGAQAKGILVEVTEAKAPVITSTLTQIKASNRSTVNLRCNAEGVPKPTIQWYYPGTNVPLTKETFASQNGSTNSKISFDDDNHVLTISAFNKAQAGMWRCTAKNQMGTDELSIEIEHVSNKDITLIIIIVVVVAVVVMVIIAVAIALILLIKKRKNLEKDKAQIEQQKSSIVAVETNDNEALEIIEERTKSDVIVSQDDNETRATPDTALKQPFEHEPDVKGIRI